MPFFRCISIAKDLSDKARYFVNVMVALLIAWAGCLTADADTYDKSKLSSLSAIGSYMNWYYGNENASYFYNYYNDVPDKDKIDDIQLKNGEIKKLTRAYRYHSNSYKSTYGITDQGLAFKLKDGMKANVKVHFRTTGTDEKEWYLVLRQGTDLHNTTNNEIAKEKGILDEDNMGAYLECDITGTANDYFFLGFTKKEGTGDNNSYILTVEICPYLTDTWIKGDPIEISTPNIGGRTVSLSHSALTFGGNLWDGTTPLSSSISLSEGTVDPYLIENLQYTNHKQLWTGEKDFDLAGTEPLEFSKDFFTGSFVAADDRLVFTATANDGAANTTDNLSVGNSTQSVTFSDGQFEYSLTETDISSLQSNGIKFEAPGYTVNGAYLLSSTDNSTDPYYYTVDEDGTLTISGLEMNDANGLSSVMVSLPAGVHAAKSGSSNVAYYFENDTEVNIPVKVTLTDPGFTLNVENYDSDYGYNLVCNGNGEVPTLQPMYGSNYVAVEEITYTINSVTPLDQSSTVIDWNSDVTELTKSNISLIWEKDTSTPNRQICTLSGLPEVYKNSVVNITCKAKYNNTYYEAKYNLVILCPYYNIGKVGSDARLLTGCLTSGEYNESLPDSTSPEWSGWENDPHDVKKYDKLGAYYIMWSKFVQFQMNVDDVSWPARYSLCLDRNIFYDGSTGYYEIDYMGYKESNYGKSARYSKITSKTNGGLSSSEDKGYGVMLVSIEGNSHGTSVTDEVKLLCTDDDTEARYLVVKIYATGSHLKTATGSSKILISKELYKFIYFKPPTVTLTGYTDAAATNAATSDTADREIKAWKVTMASNGGDNSADMTEANAIVNTYYTTDAGLPLEKPVEGENTNKYSRVYKYDGSGIKVTKSTVFFASDFVTPKYWYYTPEKPEIVSNLLPVISERALAKIIEDDRYCISDDYETKIALSTESSSAADEDALAPYDIVIKRGDIPALRLKFGAQNVITYITSQFLLSGCMWQRQQYSEEFDYVSEFNERLRGFNWGGTKNKALNDFASTHGDFTTTRSSEAQSQLSGWAGSEINADPFTECNGRIGGETTEGGGLWLTPVSGAFMRVEPEYDGVVTTWWVLNGTVDSNSTTTGYIRRRPNYIMDEDGVLMKRSTVQPTHDSYFCLDGSYVNAPGRNGFLRSFEETWRFGVLNWNNTGTISSSTNVQAKVVRDAYRFYDKWFNNVHFREKGDGKIDFSKTELVHRRDRVSGPIYHSDEMAQYIEADKGIVPDFAKYGYEFPYITFVECRMPVRAGKTYYIGGRLSKNSIQGAQLEYMEANYNPKDYRQDDNKLIGWDDSQDIGENADMMLSDIKNPTCKERMSLSDIFASYETNEDYPMYHLYTDGETTAYNGDEDYNMIMLYDEDKGYFTDGTNEILANRTMDVTLHRSFTVGYWHPIVLPFSVSESRMKELFGDNVAVLYLDPYENTMHGSTTNSDGTTKYVSAVNPAISDDCLRFTRHYYQMLYANRPAFICPSSLKDEDGDAATTVGQIVFKRVFYQGPKIRGYDIGGGYEIAGSYATTTQLTGEDSNGDDNGIYYLSNGTATDGSNVASVYHLSSAATLTMRPTRVWIQKNTANQSASAISAPMRLNSVGFQSFEGSKLDDANAEAGISDVVCDEVVIPGWESDAVYDMLGRIVGRGTIKGLPAGIYIYQNRKVVVK